MLILQTLQATQVLRSRYNSCSAKNLMLGYIRFPNEVQSPDASGSECPVFSRAKRNTTERNATFSRTTAAAFLPVEIDNVRRGDHDVFAVPGYRFPNMDGDPQLLRTARRLTVPAGEVAAVDLTLSEPR
jgi:hypothetical protein